MRGIATIDRQQRSPITAVWLTTQIGGRVAHSNAVVLDLSSDVDAVSKIRSLTRGYLIVATSGSMLDGLDLDATALTLTDIGIWSAETLSLQEALVDQFASSTAKGARLPAPVFPPLPQVGEVEVNLESSRQRAFDCAQAVSGVWRSWLATEQERVRWVTRQTSKGTADSQISCSARFEELPAWMNESNINTADVRPRLDFTALDFETASSFRGSPCAVGLVRVRDGQIVGQESFLIRPPKGYEEFSEFNIKLHGITADRVRAAPSWPEALARIVAFIGSDIVVCHNASFDTSVIRYACAASEVEWPAMRSLCTMVLARRALSLPAYRLPYVAEYLKVDVEHHEPLSDARAAASIAISLAKSAGSRSVEQLGKRYEVSIGHMSAGKYQGSIAVARVMRRGFSALAVNAEADPAGYLFGRVVVFTGTLASMTRDVARQECARVGAIPAINTTKKTNVLVVGDLNPATLRPGSHITGKARKAFDLQDKGQKIEVMTEEDFVRCLSGLTPMLASDQA